jgi:DNA polymerase III gamma/tau subunit
MRRARARLVSALWGLVSEAARTADVERLGRKEEAVGKARLGYGEAQEAEKERALKAAAAAQRRALADERRQRKEDEKRQREAKRQTQEAEKQEKQRKREEEERVRKAREEEKARKKREREEEKARKEEEQARREREKQEREEASKKLLEQQRSILASFFVRKPAPPPPAPVDRDALFHEYTPPPHTRLAPLHRTGTRPAAELDRELFKGRVDARAALAEWLGRVARRPARAGAADARVSGRRKLLQFHDSFSAAFVGVSLVGSKSECASARALRLRAR